MIGNKKIRITVSLLLVFWMSVIFIMSAQPATESSRMSGGFVSKVIDILYSDFKNFSTERQNSIINNLTFLVRKTAHFLEYFILGVLAVMLTFTLNTKVFIKISGATIFGVIYAVSDEVHQYFVPGRACRFLDVCIDSMGIICAVVVFWVIMRAVKRHKSGEYNAKKEVD